MTSAVNAIKFGRFDINPRTKGFNPKTQGRLSIANAIEQELGPFMRENGLIANVDEVWDRKTVKRLHIDVDGKQSESTPVKYDTHRIWVNIACDSKNQPSTMSGNAWRDRTGKAKREFENLFVEKVLPRLGMKPITDFRARPRKDEWFEAWGFDNFFDFPVAGNTVNYGSSLFSWTSSDSFAREIPAGQHSPYRGRKGAA